MGGVYIPREYSPGGENISRLLIEQGRAQAEGAQRSGDIWGGAVQNLGQIAGGAVQAVQMAKRDAAAVKAIESWDGKDPMSLVKSLKMYPPHEAMEMASGVVAFQSMTDKADEQDFQNLMTLAPLIPKLSDAMLERWGPALQAKAAPIIHKRFGIPLEQLQTPLPPAQIREFAQSLLPQQERRLHNAPPGTTVLDEETGQPVFTAPFEPPKPEKPPTAGSFEDYMTTTPERRAEIEAARKGYQQADDRPRITVNTGSGMSPTMEANVINRLTTQWGKAVAPVAELSRQVKLMDAGLEAARKGDLAQGAQMVLVTFQKILDPPSVVRESEYMRSAAGLALMERVKGAFERLSKGGAGVPVGELEKFAALARQAAQAQSSGYVDAVKERIGKTADRLKLPRELVFEDYDFSEALAAPTTPIGPKRITSDAEYNALPSGTEFIGPDGKRRRKP